MTAAVKIDLDSILKEAQGQFKNKDKILQNQMIRGSEIYVPSDPSDFVYWPDSPWELMTGVPGCPFGKMVQVAGKPDSGKSTHAMQFMTLSQAQDHTTLLWDPEEKFSKSRFDSHFGGCSEDLLMCRSKVILEGADMLQALVRATLDKYKDQKMFVVWDSIGGSISKGEKEKSFRESNQMAEAAKDNGRAIRGFVRLQEEYRHEKTGKHRLGFLFINQTYANINAPGQKESGGQKVEFHSSLIVQLTRVSDLFKIRQGVKRKVGITTKARLKKNHLFDGEDTIAEMKLDITAGGITVNSKDPAIKLVSNEHRTLDNDLVEGDEGDQE